MAQGERKLYEVVRDLYDEAGVPIVLIGTDEVQKLVSKTRVDKSSPWSDQFCSRIGWRINLARMRGAGGEPRPLFSEAEIREIFKSDQVRISRDGVAYLQALACAIGKGCLRLAEQCFVMAVRLAKRHNNGLVTSREAAQGVQAAAGS